MGVDEVVKDSCSWFLPKPDDDHQTAPLPLNTTAVVRPLLLLLSFLCDPAFMAVIARVI